MTPRVNNRSPNKGPLGEAPSPFRPAAIVFSSMLEMGLALTLIALLGACGETTACAGEACGGARPPDSGFFADNLGKLDQTLTVLSCHYTYSGGREDLFALGNRG